MKIARNVLEPDKHSDGGGGCFALKKTQTLLKLFYIIYNRFSSRMRILKFDSMQKDGPRLVNKNTTSMGMSKSKSARF